MSAEKRGAIGTGALLTPWSGLLLNRATFVLASRPAVW